jgi:hypothetical protein
MHPEKNKKQRMEVARWYYEEDFFIKVFEAKQRPLEPQMDTDKH